MKVSCVLHSTTSGSHCCEGFMCPSLHDKPKPIGNLHSTTSRRRCCEGFIIRQAQTDAVKVSCVVHVCTTSRSRLEIFTALWSRSRQETFTARQAEADRKPSQHGKRKPTGNLHSTASGSRQETFTVQQAEADWKPSQYGKRKLTGNLDSTMKPKPIGNLHGTTSGSR